MTELTPLIVILLAFGAAASIVFVAGQYFFAHVHLQRRVGGGGSTEPTSSAFAGSMHTLVSTYFDEKRFGLDGTVRAKLRRDLVRAGYFRPDAVKYYIFSKLAVVVAVSVLGYIAAELLLVGYGWPLKLGLVAGLTALAILAPDGYISHRQRSLTEQYRILFPDMLDLMVVCVDAGLSIEASINRLSGEILKRNRQLGMNLLLLEAEIRAGRTTSDSLEGFAERLGLDEARSLVGTLRQSIELGTNVADTLRVFSDEMRDRRLLRAEERANQLPVKMVLPLGACIFPVILMTVMIPVIIRLLSVMHATAN